MNKLPLALLNPFLNSPLSGRTDINDYLPPAAEFILTEDGSELLAEDGTTLLTG